MTVRTKGIHHITAIVGDPQENVDFYAGVLGLRLVKKTVNFDDPGTYHFYFGDRTGRPGTIMTFFPWKKAKRGQIGSGQVGTTQFIVGEGSLDFWKNRLQSYGIEPIRSVRFGENTLSFKDWHGLQLELVERKVGAKSDWSFGGIPEEMAIKGFGGAILLSIHPEKTIDLLEKVIGLERVAEENQTVRFRTESELGHTIDVPLERVGQGLMGVGTVHHIAWRCSHEESQMEWQKSLTQHGLQPTPVIDRQYFHSVYFRERGGLLFEAATDSPGFLIDESEKELGRSLKLPPQYEQHRNQLEQVLEPIEVREVTAK
ncbi:MAG TPA: ring-cleaving dioxygenase [Bacillales bacterium]|nr:ring-cleaving dioxygenase [Bacillales bacterium]